VYLGVSRHLYVEVVTCFVSDKSNQFVGIDQLATATHSRWNIAAQRDQSIDAKFAIVFQQLENCLLIIATEAQVRGHVYVLGANRRDNVTGIITGRTASTVSH
jgi:hypothetical protein